MNKKAKVLLAMGMVSLITATSALPINALSNKTHMKVTTNATVYMTINGVKVKLPLKPNCPVSPSNPSIPCVKLDVTPEGNFSAYQREVLELGNMERSKRGLATLTLDTKLSNVATIKSQDMINNNYFSHNSPKYSSPFDMMKQLGISYRVAGENIAYGQKTPKEVMNSWMNSDGHRKNILSTDFTHLGVGVAKKSDVTIYWTQMFIGK